MQINHPHSKVIDEVFRIFQSNAHGLNSDEVNKRRETFGRNILPTTKAPSFFKVFFQQFFSPLIYILGLAAVVSILLEDYTDAFFIILVLFINSIIGSIQEYGAEKSAQALRDLTAATCFVKRGGEIFQIDAQMLVPGDIVLLESGNKVPADLRLFQTTGLEIDESLLTGESLPVHKEHHLIFDELSSLGDRKNMAFTGSLIIKGRGIGIVITTGLKTEMGKIASSILKSEAGKSPLITRMEKFTKKIAIFLFIIMVFMAWYLISKGQSWHEVMVFSVALAVSAIPEGLPIALTVALSRASSRMSRRNVIVRKLPAVEALGSCSFIATDKTGTLTVNQLTIKKIALPFMEPLDVHGSGLSPEGKIEFSNNTEKDVKEILKPLVYSGVLCNEAHLMFKNFEWTGIGDAVDLAFLVLSHKSGTLPENIREKFQLVDQKPFEPENQYAATLHKNGSYNLMTVKGALEKILPMCTKMMSINGVVDLDLAAIVDQANQLASQGYRVLGLANKEIDLDVSHIPNFEGMTFLGLVGMIDPLRPEAFDAIKSCFNAGIDVAMVTGDHPKTAFAIARELGLTKDEKSVITGPEIKKAASEDEKRSLILKAKVFARVEPQQKLEIVQTLMSQGHFVAVTGDGANDAPALKVANVGVAMGKSGTDIAKETSDLIITDDRFSSIVAGIEEGRIAYNNVRKVIYLLISTGVAEIILFLLSLYFDTPLPLTAVQLLWLNLVTNGIQDIGLAFEPGEGDELNCSPRKPNEPIFNRLMIERVLLSSLVMGGVSFIYFKELIDSGMKLESARNLTLLLMVLFENFIVGNCRSETKSAFSTNPLKNKVLLFGTIGAFALHFSSLYTPGLDKLLGVEPVSWEHWPKLVASALLVLIVMEIHKLLRFSLSKIKSQYYRQK